MDLSLSTSQVFSGKLRQTGAKPKKRKWDQNGWVLTGWQKRPELWNRGLEMVPKQGEGDDGIWETQPGLVRSSLAASARSDSFYNMYMLHKGNVTPVKSLSQSSPVWKVCLTLYSSFKD